MYNTLSIVLKLLEDFLKGNDKNARTIPNSNQMRNIDTVRWESRKTFQLHQRIDDGK